MASELSKTYDPAAVHAEVAAVWDAERCFRAEPADAGEPYSIVIPPPNVTAALHLGHALNNTIQDILIRRARMQGKNAVWLPGTDHAGIATQTVVEKRVLKEEGRRRTDFPRDEFVAKIQAWKDEYEKVILGQLKSMGCSCDFERTAFTMDEPRAKAVREAFFQLFKAGLIYRGKRLVNWDPVTQTALADDEVENEEIDGFFYYLKYPLCDATGAPAKARPKHGAGLDDLAKITVATTRPETMLGDTAVALNPTDPRAAALKGLFVKLPIVGRIIPIIEDDYVVKPVQFGGDPADAKAQMATGFLKVTPAHDSNDYDIGQRHGLPVINVMAPDASISDKHGWTDGIGDADFLLGKSRETAREEIVEWFRRHGLLEDVKPYRHSVGHSYRSHVPIEPYLSDQWYCRVTDDRLRGAALRAMSPEQGGPVTGSINFYPARYAKTYQTWHENIRDWCISRQLWWGHRIPVWTKYSGKTGPIPGTWAPMTEAEQAEVAAENEEYPDFVEHHLNVRRWRDEGRLVFLLHFADGADDDDYPEANFYCVRDINDHEVIASIEKHGYVQDPDVLDTWFSSGLWPLSTLGWTDNLDAEATTPRGDAPSEENCKLQIANRKSTPELAKWNPTTVLTTAREIITLWVSRMVMFNEFFLGQIPFKDVFIHAMIQDGEGRKMSKSLGNGVDPLDIIHSHGADAMRFTLASMCTQTQDVRMPVVKDEATGRNTSTKFDLGRNFSNKLWNAARFVLSQITQTQSDTSKPTPGIGWAFDAKHLTVADRWIISRMNRTIKEINDAIEGYRFDQYAKSLYDFFWRDFCDWYVESAKPQMKVGARRDSTAAVLSAVLDASLRLLHPVTPFITEKLWWNLNETVASRSLAGLLDLPPAKRLIKAAWPKAGAIDESAEAAFGIVQDVVAALRNLRSTYKLDPKKLIAVHVRAPADASAALQQLRPALELLATCTLAAVGPDIAGPTNATRAQAGACELLVADLVDPAAEKLRTIKRREELTRAIAALRARRDNAGYMAKAPPHLVQQTHDQLAEAEAELASLG